MNIFCHNPSMLCLNSNPPKKFVNTYNLFKKWQKRKEWRNKSLKIVNKIDKIYTALRIVMSVSRNRL